MGFIDRLIDKYSPVRKISIPRKRKEKKVLEPTCSQYGNYVEKNYCGEDMVEFFALILLKQMKSGCSSNVDGRILDVIMRLSERGLYDTVLGRTVKTDFVEMRDRALITKEKEQGLDMIDQIPGRAAYLQMQKSLDSKISDDALLICRTFVEDWDWGAEIK